MARKYDFVQVDVFTKTPLAGNPLAIFTDASGLTDQEMQALAREMNLSETTFIFPAPSDVETKKGRRVRIFTPQEELPFAGHPTLGTALYIYSTAAFRGRDEISLGLNVGKIGVRFRADASDKSDRISGNVFGEMRQRDPEFGPILPRDKVTEVLHAGGDAVSIEQPSQVVSTGLPFAIVPIRDVQGLSNLKPDLVRIDALLAGTDARFCYFIAPEEEDAAGWRRVRARMFFYGGEDPATGSAAGCAIAWMVRHGLVASDEQVRIRQGIEAGRASEIFVSATRRDDGVVNIRVGGYAVEVLRGTVTL